MSSTAQDTEDPTRWSRRERNKHTTRTELISAARKLFAERGLYEPRIEDLTAAAGIAKGTIYGYFSSKEELALAVVRLGFRELQGLVRERLRRSGPSGDRIVRIVRAHVDFFARNPDLLRVFHQVRGVLKFNQLEWRPLRRPLAGHIEVLADLLHEGQPLPGPRRRTLRQARAMFGAISGVLSMDASLDPGVRHAPLSREALRGIVLLTRALGAPRAPRRADSPMREHTM